MVKLSAGHIRDLTTPRYTEELIERGNMRPYKTILDNHCSVPREISPKFSIDSDLSTNVDELNTEYHNQVIEFLLGEGIIDYGNSLKRINRSSWLNKWG